MKNKYQSLENDLRNLSCMKIGIENMKSEYEELGDVLTGVDTSREFINTYSVSDITGTRAELLAELSKRISKLEKKVMRIEKAVNSLTRTERIIIENYYYNRIPYYMFTNLVGYSERQCKRIKRTAMHKLHIALYGF